MKKTILLAILAAATVLFGGLPADANSLDVNAPAALTGSVGTACGGSPCGLEVVLVDQGQAYVQSDHPNQEPTVTLTFRIDANDVVLPNLVPAGTPGRFRVLKGYREAGNNPRQHLFVTLKRNIAGTNYRMAVLQRDQNSNFQFVGEFFLGNADREVQILWDKTGGVGNGSVTVFRDGAQVAQRDLDLTPWNIDRVRVGAIDMTADNFNATGSIFLDEYVSTR